MAHILASRVAETCTGTNGAMTLTGAYVNTDESAASHSTFASKMANGDTAEVVIRGTDGKWERCVVTYVSASNTLTRSAPVESSTGAAVTFSAGTLLVFLVGPRGSTFLDKGNSGTATQTFNYPDAVHQKVTTTGAHTVAFSGWPSSGRTAAFLLELANAGSAAITWPTINWVKPDGTTTTSVATWLAATTGRTAFQTSGVDFIKVWSRDAGATLFGAFAA